MHFNFFYDIILKESNNYFNIKNIFDFINIVNFFKNSLLFLFCILIDICVSDYLYLKNRFKISYNIFSGLNTQNLFYNYSLGILSSFISLSIIFKSSLWLEREVFDMFGIKFINNWDMRRILTDYTFFGFPLRKDFPLSGYMELIYDEKKKSTTEVLIELMQEMRFFSVSSNIELWDLNISV